MAPALKEVAAIVEKHFNVSWLELDCDARAKLFYYFVDHGKVDGGMAAPETTEEGCMPPHDVRPLSKTCWAELGAHFHDCWRWRKRVIQELPNSV